MKSEPESLSVNNEPQEDAWEPEQPQAESAFKVEQDQGVSHEVKVESHDHDDDYDRPIGIKEDG